MKASTVNAVVAIAALAACGGNDSGAETDTPAASQQRSQAGPVRAAPTDIKVCGLLTDAQVTSVLPGHTGGMEAASGSAMFGDDTRSYKCSYDKREGNAVFFFTLDLTVGEFGVSSYEMDRQMAESEGSIHREIGVADGGWVEKGDDWLGQGVPYVTATLLKNPTEISILLMTPDSHDQVDKVIELASSVASGLN